MDGENPSPGDVLIEPDPVLGRGYTLSTAPELLMKRVTAEFVEMPGLRLTIDQAARLWGLERDKCQALLQALVYQEFLSVKADGKYARISEGAARRVPPRAAKATLQPTARSASKPAGRRAGGRSSHD
jgi:hypothetical protein